MKRKRPGSFCKMQRLAFLLSAYFCLSGCAAIPPIIDYASMALSTVTYLSTGKGPSDHALSLVVKKDCSLLRLLLFKPICIPVNENTNKSLFARFFRKEENEFNYDVPPPPTLSTTPILPIPTDHKIAKLE